MKIFLFPKCEWKYILFLLFFVFSFLQNAIIRWISWNSKDVALPFLNTYLFNVSDYLSSIPLLIVKFRSRKRKEEENKLNKLSSVKTNYIFYTIILFFYFRFFFLTKNLPFRSIFANCI